MLSGFLGAGKTTLLRYLLENSKEKVACIVNDVASINIDAKLVRNDRNRSRNEQVNTTADLTDTIELANGCACCNLQDELFASFEQVLALADKKGQPYARIILENSGVAEPHNIRDRFTESAADGHPLMSRIELDTLVTVVDSGTFIKDYSTRAPLAARPDLGDGGSLRPVVDLLVEQIECADFVLLNKIDMVPGGMDGDGVQQLCAIVATLNPLATVIPCEHSKIPLERVFGSSVHKFAAQLNIEGQHRGAVAAAKTAQAAEQHSLEHQHDHDHSHHQHADHHHDDDCKDHDHQHHHDHGDHKHKHGEHQHAHKEADHDHNHHTHGDAHDNDHKHHHHEHKHKHADETRAATRFGIRSFVYSRRRPFHPQRLRDTVLRWLPVTDNKALEGAAPETADSPIKAVLRSKGFMWMSNSHTTAYYWSHAGQHFEIREEGDWWAAVPDEEWPADEAQREVVLTDFEEAVGDRRQEIVFIGVNMEEDKICAQLDGALLSDDEMAKYGAKWASLPDPPHARAGNGTMQQ
eukprot:jgi/Chrzof1/4714/Cz14g23240.t1